MIIYYYVRLTRQIKDDCLDHLTHQILCNAKLISKIIRVDKMNRLFIVALHIT